MQKAKDRRTRKTKRAIRNSFAELIAQKPIQQITIQELVDRADLSRGAFYLYYQDIYDLERKVNDEVFEEMVQQATEYAQANEMTEPYPYILESLNYIVANKSVCEMLLRKNGNDGFFVHFTETLEHFIPESWLKPINIDYSPTMLSYYSVFVSYGFASVVVKWIEEGMPQSPEEMADILGHIMDCGLDALRKRPH